ncbi:MAG: oxidoreductase [Chloroflexi bacterium]|nr:oxidoreductase [Chloroflexota bacterium]
MDASYIEKPQPIHVGRRVFLGALGVGIVGLALGVRRLPGLNLLASAFSVNGFQIYTTSGIPQLNESNYALSVDGLVNQPTKYKLAELLAMPSTKIVKDYHCVTGWVVPSCRWEGIKLGDFLNAVQPKAQAKYVLLSSADGSYTESLTMDQAHLPDVLLGFKLNDKPLSAEQGYPLRLVIPDMYGFKYIKWVNRITLSNQLQPGYWEQRGYAVDAWLGPRSNYGYAT